jgi:tryptophanyl-tRNA synthetase
MSKSAHDPSSRILLTDTPDEIRLKIKKAVTDSVPGVGWDPPVRPGVANLIQMLRACEREALGGSPTDDAGGGEEEVLALAGRYSSPGRGIKDLKTDVADAIVETLRGPREEFQRIRGEVGYLDSVARLGADKAKPS